MTKDSATAHTEDLDERRSEKGPAGPRKVAQKATETRLYFVDEHSTVLIHEGDQIPPRLVGLEHAPAKLEGGVWVPVRKRRPNAARTDGPAS